MYRTLFNKISDGFFIVQFIMNDSGKPIDFRIIEANPAVKKQTGYYPSELNGKLFTEVFPSIGDAWLKHFDELLTTEKNIHFEEYSSSFKKWYEVDAFPLPEFGLYGMLFKNVSARKREEEIFRIIPASSAGEVSGGGEKELLQSILSSIPVMITIYDPQVTNIIVNKEFEKISGWSQEEINQGNIMEMVYPDPEQRDIVSDFMINGSGWMDFNMTIKDSTKIQTSWANVKLPDGRQVGIGLDIRDRVKAEEAIKINQQIMEAFFDTSPGILNLFDEKLNYLKTDPVTPTYFNLDRQSIIGKNISELNGEFVQKFLIDLFNRIITSKEVVQSIEVEGPVPSRMGETGYWLMSYFPVPLPEAKTGLGVMGVDISDKKKAELALKESEEKYRELAGHFEVEKNKLAAIIDNLPIGIGIEDADGKTIALNKEGLGLHGFKSEEEMLSQLQDYFINFEILHLNGEIMNSEDWPASRALRGDYVQNYELILRNKKAGTSKILSYSVVPVRDPHAEVIFLVYVIQDLTENKESEQALKESEERFRTLADNISQLAWMAEKNGDLFWYNKRWYDFTGTTFDEMKGWGWRKVHHPDHVKRVEEKFRDYVDKGKPWEDTFPLRNSKGEYRWFLSRALPVYNQSGEIVRWFGTNTDITQQKKLEDELSSALLSISENESKLLEAQKLALMGSLEIYLDSGMMPWSETLYEIFERDKALGPPQLSEALDYIHPDDREKVSNALQTGINNASKIELEFRISLKSGKIKYLYYILSPDPEASVGQRKLVGAVMDITERKLAQLKLEEAYAQIEERLNEKEVLLRELYHRTKNNMQVVSSLLGLKASAFSDPSAGFIISEMQSRIRSIALVHEKLYQSGNLSKVNLKDYIVDLVELLLESHSSPDEKVSVEYDLEDVKILIDVAVPCGLIITELVINSVKHAFPDGRRGIIKIVLKRLPDESIQLCVGDNGVGFKEDELGTDETLGIHLFKSIAENQLDAKVYLTVDNGVKWTIEFEDKFYNERI